MAYIEGDKGPGYIRISPTGPNLGEVGDQRRGSRVPLGFL